MYYDEAETPNMYTNRDEQFAELNDGIGVNEVMPNEEHILLDNLQISFHESDDLSPTEPYDHKISASIYTVGLSKEDSTNVVLTILKEGINALNERAHNSIVSLSLDSLTSVEEDNDPDYYPDFDQDVW
jgi:hypothetical protein